MTYFDKIAESMKLKKTGIETIDAMADFFNEYFLCPPWNDHFEDGCEVNPNCKNCWRAFLGSEIEK